MEHTSIVAQWANNILVWIGFGTVIGLIAKAIMPGRDPGGAIATLGTGITGTIVGCGTYTYLIGGTPVTPISPVGFIVATAGASLILFSYKMLAGYLFQEGETNLRLHMFRRSQYRRRSTRRAA